MGGYKIITIFNIEKDRNSLKARRMVFPKLKFLFYQGEKERSKGKEGEY